MKRQNSKSWRSNLIGLCSICFICVSVLSTERMPAPEPRALQDVFKNDFMIGAALNRRQIFEDDARGVAIVSKQFNTITPENVLKWALVHPKPDAYDFTAADRFVAFGEKRGMF